MFRRFLPIVFFLLCFASCVSAAPPSQRIVSLSPGTTEMLFALGLGKYLVGDTTYCDYPPAAYAIAKVGDVYTSYDKVLALRPTLIVADSTANARAVARLSALRQPVLAVAPTSLSAALLAPSLEAARPSSTWPIISPIWVNSVVTTPRLVAAAGAALPELARGRHDLQPTPMRPTGELGPALGCESEMAPRLGDDLARGDDLRLRADDRADP